MDTFICHRNESSRLSTCIDMSFYTFRNAFLCLVTIAVLGCSKSNTKKENAQIDNANAGHVSPTLKQRCQKIIAGSINNATSELSFPLKLYRSNLLPIEEAKAVFMKALKSDDPEIRLIAAELLLEKSTMQFRDEILSSLNGMNFSKKTTYLVRRAVVLMKTGSESSKQEVTHWAEHELINLKTDDWICPMMCARPSKKAGRCPVCEMALTKRTRSANYDDWEAKLIALQALQKSGQQVSSIARSIMVSDAPAKVRIQAAGLWAKEDPEAAIGHLKFYLQSDLPYLVLTLMGDHAAKDCIDEFKHFVRPETVSTYDFEAYRGLLLAGETDCLPQIRNWVDQKATTDDQRRKKLIGIHLLGILMLNEDIIRLEKILNTDFKVEAAEAILMHKSRN